MRKFFRSYVPPAATLILLALQVGAQTLVEEARHSYQRTDYAGTIAKLKASSDSPSLLLLGQSYFMLGEYKQSIETLERAQGADPQNSDIYMWLGRAYGRRAESAFALAAPGLANKARENMEKAVALNPKNWDAQDDLFEYYLNAPGFLGGGVEKAEKLAQIIAAHSAADGALDLARIANQKKQYEIAEAQLRRSVQLEPSKVVRRVDLARFLAKRGQTAESDAEFTKALQAEPNNPRVVFARAQTLVQNGRELPQARDLLKRYLTMELTPDDPPRREAEKLLKKASGS